MSPDVIRIGAVSYSEYAINKIGVSWVFNIVRSGLKNPVKVF